MEPKQLVESNAWIYIVATGAGAGVQDLLWSVPGASTFFAGASFPYARSELTKFIGYEPLASVNECVAVDMAIASYLRACASCPKGCVPIGVGCTASVATLTPHRGEHRAWVAVIGGQGHLKIRELVLPKGGPEARRGDGSAVDRLMLDLLDDTIEDAGDFEQLEVLERHVLSRPLFTASGWRPGKDVINGNLELMPGAFNPIHSGHLAISSPDTIFQLSLRTPHKPEVLITEALRRVATINANGRDALIEAEASTFLAKARKWPCSTFIIGSDTLERMLDPKYGHPIEEMLSEMHALFISFKISQRDGTPDARELIASTPGPWKNGPMMQVLPKTAYSGLSSTKIRNETP